MAAGGVAVVAVIVAVGAVVAVVAVVVVVVVVVLAVLLLLMFRAAPHSAGQLRGPSAPFGAPFSFPPAPPKGAEGGEGAAEVGIQDSPGG